MNDLTEPEILFSKQQVQERVKAMGASVTADFQSKKLIVIAVSNGATVFVADLIRSIQLPLMLDTVTASSYSGTESKGKVSLFSNLKLDVGGCDILLVDDILDTGRTMSRLIEFITAKAPASLKTCVLLDKPSRRIVDITADYVGFEIQDLFVVGYGLDYNEYYRNLQYIGYLTQHESYSF